MARDYGAIKPSLIPYTSMVVPLAALIHVEEASGDPDARKKVDCWYWHSVFYRRYETSKGVSLNKIIAKDFVSMTSWILGKSDKPKMENFVKWGEVPRDMLSLLEQTQYKEDGQQPVILKAVLNLIALEGARDLLSGRPPETDWLVIDHLYPKSGSHQSRRMINSVLNLTLLDKRANEKKGAKEPKDLYKEILEGHQKDPESVKKTFKSHIVGDEAMEIFIKSSNADENANKFFEERKKDLQKAIENRLKGC